MMAPIRYLTLLIPVKSYLLGTYPQKNRRKNLWHLRLGGLEDCSQYALPAHIYFMFSNIFFDKRCVPHKRSNVNRRITPIVVIVLLDCLFFHQKSQFDTSQAW